MGLQPQLPCYTVHNPFYRGQILTEMISISCILKGSIWMTIDVMTWARECRCSTPNWQDVEITIEYCTPGDRIKTKMVGESPRVCFTVAVPGFGGFNNNKNQLSEPPALQKDKYCASIWECNLTSIMIMMSCW
jgi:hypothetical protein